MKNILAVILFGLLVIPGTVVTVQAGYPYANAAYKIYTQEQVPELPPESYPGQRSHGKPPDGWFCYRDTELPPDTPSAHICDCNRKCVISKPGEEPPPPMPEDSKCTVYCHKEHCHCDMECSMEPGPTDPVEPPHVH